MAASFPLGRVVMTQAVDISMRDDIGFAGFVQNSFNRYRKGDWGDTCTGDSRQNDAAVKNGDDRIFAKYVKDDSRSIYIITEWDRSYTTILLPEDY